MMRRPTILRRLWGILLLFISVIFSMTAQYDAVFSQYNTTSSFYNPASVGQQKGLIISAAYHQQWIGIKGAPANFLLAGNARLKFFNWEHGVGITAVGQKKGLFLQTEISGTYSFLLPLWGGRFSLGLQASLFTTSFDGTKVFIPDGEGLTPNDPAIPLTKVGGKAFDSAVGISYTHPKFFIGFATRHLLNPKVRLNETHYLYLRRNFILHGGATIRPITSALSWYPSVLAMTDLQSYRVDVNLTLGLYEKFFAGVLFRPLNAAGFNLGMKWNDLFVGYAFEMPINELARGNWGSHELVLSYHISLKKRKNKGVRSKSIRLL